MTHSKGGLVHDKVQSQASQVCVPGTGPVGLAGGCMESWQDLDACAFPPVVILGRVVTKLLKQGCIQMILIALGWPNMPWFCDLVSMSVQISLSLPRV